MIAKLQLLPLIDELKRKTIHACFDWTAANDTSLFSCLPAFEQYKKPIEELLQTRYPFFKKGHGSYGEVFVYTNGKIEIFYNKRIISEESESLVFYI